MAGQNCNYALVQQVQITNIDETEKAITFATRSNDKKLTSYTTDDANVMWHGPAQAPKAVPKVVGKVGNLYLDKEGWAAAKAGGGIFGYSANAADSTVLFKWPQCYPFLPVEELDLIPSTVVVVDSAGKEHKLFDAAQYAAAQHLVWNAAQNITLMTHANKAIEVWPVKLLVTGKPRSGGIEGTVDVLDGEYGDFTQMLSWSKPGAVIAPVLRPAGFGEFDAVMDSARAVAEGRKVTYPGPTIDEWNKVYPKLSKQNQHVIDAGRARVEKLAPEERKQGSR